jgi:hypothetical protein
MIWNGVCTVFLHGVFVKEGVATGWQKRTLNLSDYSKQEAF